jgi:hypothetical protein
MIFLGKSPSLNGRPYLIFHVEMLSRLTGVSLLMVDAPDKDAARRLGYREINRHGFNHFVRAVLTQEEMEAKYGPVNREAPKLTGFRCEVLDFHVTFEECEECKKKKIRMDCLRA